MQIKKTLIFFFGLIFLTSLFLFLSYDNNYHADDLCYLYVSNLESFDDYNWFNDKESTHYGFYEAKIGHIFLLHQIVSFFGDGTKSFFYISLVYALLTLVFIFIVFFILKELFEDKLKAYLISIFAAFLPVILFVAYKMLSEIPALIFGALSILLFLYGLKKDLLKSIGFYLVSACFLFLTAINRLDAPILFFSFSIALFFFKKFKIKKLFYSAMIVTIFFISILTMFIIASNINPYIFLFSSNVLDTPRNWFSTFIGPFLMGGFFNFLVLFSFLKYKTNEFKFAFTWLLLSSTPIMISYWFIEMRYLIWGVIPFAILCFIGFREIMRRLNKLILSKMVLKCIGIIIFGIILVMNLPLTYYHLYSINGDDLIAVYKEIERGYENKIILVSDGYNLYSFLKFNFPKAKIFVTNNNTEKQWKNVAIKNLDELKGFNETKIQIYNTRFRREQFIYKIRVLLDKWGVKKIKDDTSKTVDNSWIWDDENIYYEKILQKGLYEAYILHIKEDKP